METIKQNIIKFGEDRKRPYAESSIKTYLGNISKLYDKIKDPLEDFDEMENMDWALDAFTIEQVLAPLKPTTQRNYYNALIVGLYAYPGQKSDEVRHVYEGRRDILNADYDKSKGEPTENQAKVLQSVNKNTIMDMIRNTIPTKNTGRMDDLTRLLFLIHSEYPFRNELSKIQVIQEEQYEAASKTQNYLLISKVGKGIRLRDHNLTFKMNDTKTAKKYGSKTIPLDVSHVKMEILKWLKEDVKVQMNDLLPVPTYLFTWATGKPLLRNDISHLMSNFSNKHIGHSVSTTLMAKMFNDIPDGNTATKEQIDKVQKKALIRGHSVQISASVYNPNLK